ncbi:hypothetical protein LuPra_04237 [Luteitalea pratensis]|uniref:Adhesin domain-containing protein n=1 Tax=Luteitalea pratensis TaxID=1855912 RepID=A0A143PS49_LUTPR|nr:hypothetical protein [Luteitalea pratensis]AMY10993.1 hypothetical protein LuPra_04237 [Luteitalea pratensis]
MGKRELLLLVVFVVLGVGVYQVSAPAAPADTPGFSLSRLVQMAKAHFHGPQVRRTVTRTATLTVPEDTDTLDLGEIRGTVVVEGTDQAEVSVRLEAMLGGMDDADVARQEKAVQLEMKSDGTTASLSLQSSNEGPGPRYEMRGGPRPHYEVRVEMPKRLKLRLAGRGTAEVSGIAGLELDEYRGELTTEAVSGPITGDIRDARAEFGAGAILDLDTKNGRIRAEGPASVNLRSERGSVDIVDPKGAVAIKTDFARMDIRGTGGPVTITGEGGVIDLRDVAHPLTIEADRLTVSAELATPVATTITVSDDTVDVTLPRQGGVQLEASIEDGALRLPGDLTSTKNDQTESVSAAIAGGGPIVKIVVKGGEVRIRSRAPQPGT